MITLFMVCFFTGFGLAVLSFISGLDNAAAARALKPINERQVFGRSILLFDGVAREQLTQLGEVRTPGIADLFVAVMGAPQ